MNRKIFWKLRKIILKIVFNIKRVIYRIIDFISGNSEYSSFGRMVVKASFFGIMKATIFVIILLWMDELVFKIGNVPKVDKNIFVSFVIGGISIAGVILGLYCANIASIYSSRYANAPRSIAIAFQYDRLTRRCISAIVDYIIFGFLVTFATMLEFRIGWVMITIFIFWSIVVIVSYSIAGNRAYQLSDVYGVAADSNRILYRIISKRLNQKLFSTDANFQNHFQKVAERQIRLLKSIQKYGENINKSENLDNSAMTEFMLNNLVTVKLYWMIKKNLSRSSLWFRDKPRYPKWHFSSSTESSIALRTGTPLKTKGKHNLWWFEEELISINKQCLNNLFEQFDYVSIYTYITAF